MHSESDMTSVNQRRRDLLELALLLAVVPEMTFARQFDESDTKTGEHPSLGGVTADEAFERGAAPHEALEGWHDIIELADERKEGSNSLLEFDPLRKDDQKQKLACGTDLLARTIEINAQMEKIRAEMPYLERQMYDTDRFLDAIEKILSASLAIPSSDRLPKVGIPGVEVNVLGASMTGAVEIVRLSAYFATELGEGKWGASIPNSLRREADHILGKMGDKQLENLEHVRDTATKIWDFTKEKYGASQQSPHVIP